MTHVNWWLVIGIAVMVTLVASYASWTAGRIDRLHHRVAAARAALEIELAHRAALVAEVAASGLLDPASSLLLLDAADRARTATGHDREQCESALTRAIAATLGGTVRPADEPARIEAWAGELASTVRRVQMARRFHNDIVATTRNLRRRRLVSWLRLAGHAPMPGTIELDDAS